MVSEAGKRICVLVLYIEQIKRLVKNCWLLKKIKRQGNNLKISWKN